MANFVFGDCVEITCQHVLGRFSYFPKANESFTIDKGGIRNNDDANQITSNGQLMIQKNRTRWSVEGPIAFDQISDDQMTTLNQITESPITGTWTFSFLSGGIYTGNGMPVGDLQGDSNAGTMTLKIVGGGILAKIS
jgi:hypothetical protein